MAIGGFSFNPAPRKWIRSSSAAENDAAATILPDRHLQVMKPILRGLHEQEDRLMVSQLPAAICSAK